MKYSKLLISVLVVAVSLSLVHADTAVSVTPVSGTDSTDSSALPFTNTDLVRLSSSNDSRIQSNAAWPGSGAYDESKYLEFIFNPQVPSNATISSVNITHEFRRATILTAAKLEIWDGTSWHDAPLNLPSAINTDLSQTVDASAWLLAPASVNNLKVRFLAYRDSVATSAMTSHDFIGVAVNYTIATPSDNQTPIDTAEVSATPSDTPAADIKTPTPTITVSDELQTETPTPTPTPNQELILNSSPTPTPSLSPSATPTPTPTPTPTATPTPVLTPTPTPTQSLGSTTATRTFTPTPMITPMRTPGFIVTTPTPFVMTPTPTVLPLAAVMVTPRIHKVAQTTPIPDLSEVALSSQSSEAPFVSAVMNIWHLAIRFLSTMIRK
jgi:hypothetical protein